jgi:hypothetical protein
MTLISRVVSISKNVDRAPDTPAAARTPSRRTTRSIVPVGSNRSRVCGGASPSNDQSSPTKSESGGAGTRCANPTR